MKKRIVKCLLVIIGAGLAYFNLNLLFDTTEVPLIGLQVANASINGDGYEMEQDQQVNENFLPMHYLDVVTCWDFYVSIDGITIIILNGTFVPVPVIEDFKFGAKGKKKDCEKVRQIIYCDVFKQTDCAPERLSDEGEINEDSPIAF